MVDGIRSEAVPPNASIVFERRQKTNMKLIINATKKNPIVTVKKFSRRKFANEEPEEEEDSDDEMTFVGEFLGIDFTSLDFTVPDVDLTDMFVIDIVAKTMNKITAKLRMSMSMMIMLMTCCSSWQKFVEYSHKLLIPINDFKSL
jgi:hypothetical protein